MKKLFLPIGILCATLLGLLAACTDADVVSSRLSQDADYFKVQRRIVFYASVPMKGVENLLSIEGLCSLGNNDKPNEVTVTCKDGPEDYKKHFLHLGPTEGYVVEQTQGLGENPYHYRVIFRPETIVPSFEVR